jgi:hypothetical protein
VIVEPIGIPIPPIIVPVQIANVEVAVRVAVLYTLPSMSPPFEYSQGCI